jgi:dTDP-4-amino-4,6-dideoxygalactose transaminase
LGRFPIAIKYVDKEVGKLINIAKPMLSDDEKQALSEVVDSGLLVQGPKVKAFEDQFAEYTGTKHAIAASSGTTALVIGLQAMGVVPGDEVIAPSFTFLATASSIKMCGAVPVFVDVDPVTFNIDPGKTAEAVTDKTKAILPVHLYGLPADMDALNKIAEEHSLEVLEDACQAHGAKLGSKRVGSLGGAGCFSFYPTKNMTTGEGGIITTNSDELAEKCRLIRNHGQAGRYHYVYLGYNYRMTEFAGAIGAVQLTKLDSFNSRRQENAAKLTEMLGKTVITPTVLENMTHVFHQYTIKLESEEQRDRLIKYLQEHEVGSAVYYPIGLHEVDFLQGRVPGSLENTEKLTKTVLSLPVHPGLDDKELETIANEVKAGLSN